MIIFHALSLVNTTLFVLLVFQLLTGFLDLINNAGNLKWFLWLPGIGGLKSRRRGFLIALKVAGESLTHKRGAPARLIAPNHRGFELVEWVARIPVPVEATPEFFPIPSALAMGQSSVCAAREIVLYSITFTAGKTGGIRLSQDCQ